MKSVKWFVEYVFLVLCLYSLGRVGVCVHIDVVCWYREEVVRLR